MWNFVQSEFRQDDQIAQNNCEMINVAKFKEVKERFHALNELIADPIIAADPSRMAVLGPEQRELSSVVEAIEHYEIALKESEEMQELIRTEEDAELVALAQEELGKLTNSLPTIEENIKQLLIPKDPADARGAIVEIRAGTGGSEAALFVADLFRLYERYTTRKRWTLTVMSRSEGSVGGFKEVVFEISGSNVYGSLKYENGVHRVQRVPQTESSGRLHTSAASVAVLPEATEVEIEISPSELKIDVYRSSGPGGQSVNTTDSAVRITHIPTGLVVTCQDEKSQHKNKDKALRVLRSRLYEKKLSEMNAERDAVRRQAVGSGDRSVKIRTYNFPQDRVTDHRLQKEYKNYPLRKIIEGEQELDELLNALQAADYADRVVTD